MNFLKLSKKEIRNYFVAFLLIANSGFPFFTNEPYLLLVSFLFTLVIFDWHKFLTNRLFVTTIFVLIILVIGQSLLIGLSEPKTIITLFIRWLYPATSLLILSTNFVRYYINILYYLAIFSLLLFIPSIFIPSIDNILLSLSTIFEQTSSSDFYNYNSNILIYTIRDSYAIENISFFKRNSGPFWEAGGFAVYLVLAIIFNVKDRSFWTRKNIVFVIALITTWSTGGFIAFGFFMFLYSILIIKEKRFGLILFLIVPVTFYYIYNELDFFQARVDRSIVYYNHRSDVDYERRDRMVSAIIDFETFLEHPIFGTGRSFEGRFGKTTRKTYLEHRNNGLTDFLVKYGVVFFLFYFFKLYQSFKLYAISVKLSLPRNYGIISLGTLMILGFSQGLFQYSFFIALFYFSSFEYLILKRD